MQLAEGVLRDGYTFVPSSEELCAKIRGLVVDQESRAATMKAFLAETRLPDEKKLVSRLATIHERQDTEVEVQRAIIDIWGLRQRAIFALVKELTLDTSGLGKEDLDVSFLLPIKHEYIDQAYREVTAHSHAELIDRLLCELTGARSPLRPSAYSDLEYLRHYWLVYASYYLECRCGGKLPGRPGVRIE